MDRPNVFMPRRNRSSNGVRTQGGTQHMFGVSLGSLYLGSRRCVPVAQRPDTPQKRFRTPRPATQSDGLDATSAIPMSFVAREGESSLSPLVLSSARGQPQAWPLPVTGLSSVSKDPTRDARPIQVLRGQEQRRRGTVAGSTRQRAAPKERCPLPSRSSSVCRSSAKSSAAPVGSWSHACLLAPAFFRRDSLHPG
jgi:hypothetical protein